MLPLAFVLAALQQPAAVAANLPPQVSDTSPFRRLVLPTATPLRAGSGAPGPRYWQQRADYTIRASLDTATHTITGSETIRYANNSPDTLTYLWLQLDQNIYRAASRGAAINPTDARFAGRGFEGGYTIQYVRAVQRFGKASGRAPLATTVNGTVMRAEPDRPLPPGQAATLELAYSFEVPEHGSDRMDTEQYLGQGEFYLDYGDFDVAITVPRSFVVAATGTLLNPLEVLTGPQRARLAQAAKSDTTVAVIAKTEVGQAFTRPAGAGPTLTWRYSAKNVRDVAWAAAPNFIWDASGYAGVLIQSLYPPEANAGWARSTEYARHSIKHYSEKWFRYPYPTAINVAGPVGGMEYPMIVFCGHRAGDRNLFGVTTALLGSVEYGKPAAGLYLLRQQLLDDTTRFDAAFRGYIRRWAYRHPTPADFFRSMEDALGEDLSWFWRGWFYRTDVVDLALDSVRVRQDSSGPITRIFLASPGGLPMPVDMRITLANGSAETVRLPVEIWLRGNHYLYERKFAADVVKVEIDPGQNFPDVRRENNVWTKS